MNVNVLAGRQQVGTVPRAASVVGLSDADIATLTSGGGADLLHTHAAATSPWFACGVLSDLYASPQCAMAGYSNLEYEYGFSLVVTQ